MLDSYFTLKAIRNNNTNARFKIIYLVFLCDIDSMRIKHILHNIFNNKINEIPYYCKTVMEIILINIHF